MTKKRVLCTCLALMIGILSGVTNLFAFSTNQLKNITGKVVTTDGLPLEGVSISIKGKNKQTTTNPNGEFSLSNVDPKDILVIAYVGFATQEININTKTVFNITIINNFEKLDEVVVVGYGTIAKSDFTGSSSKVTLEKVADNRYVSPLEALQGRVAGVQILNNTGEPGSGLTFNIRGVTSINGSGQPLIVIDGQPVESSFGSTQAGIGLDGGMAISPIDPLAGLNPSDIESIEILKDASSTAIYGSRGANGVVLITTKSGKLGADRITFSSRIDYNAMPGYLDVLNAREYMAFVNEAITNNNQAPRYTQGAVDSIASLGSFDWQRLVLKNGFSHDQNISLSGKDDRNNYLISGNFTDQNSLILNAGFERYGLRVNYERKVSKKLTFGIKSNFSMVDRQYGQQSNWTGITGSNAVRGAMMQAPIQSAFNEDGDIDMDFVNNPLIVTTLVKDNTKVRLIVLNANLNYNFNKYLKYTLIAGANDISSLRQIYHPRGTFLGNSAPNGVAVRADNNNTNYVVDNLLSYNRILAKKHSINAVTGFSYQHWNNKGSSVTNRDFPSDALGYENFQTANAPGVMQTFNRSRALQSILGRVNYAYNRKYLLTLTGRADGSSRLAEDHKWGYFYSAGLGWNVHNEKFFPASLDFINNLKLRGSYGISGMENVSIGATQSNYQLNYVNIGSTILPGYVQGDFDNPNLGWESTSQLNLGADFGIAKNRVTFSVDLYRKRTTDLLFNLPLPPSSTYVNYFTNMGEIVNKGIDFEGRANVWNKKSFRIDIGGNFSMLRNEVVNMGSLDAIYGGSYMAGGSILLGQPVHIATPGFGVPSFWGYKTNGIYQNQNEIDADPALVNDATRSNVQPGMVKFVDVNNDGQITDADKTIIGSPFPKFSYGFNTNFSYKKFSLGMVFLGSEGNQILNLNSWVLEANNITGGFNSTRRAYEGAWRGEGTSNLYPALSTATTRMNQRLPDWMIEDASFFRMQSLSMSYTFNLPKSFGPSSSVRAYLSGTNLFTITKYSGYDPAINAFGSSLLNSGVDMGTLPQPRTYSLGFEFNF